MFSLNKKKLDPAYVAKVLLKVRSILLKEEETFERYMDILKNRDNDLPMLRRLVTILEELEQVEHRTYKEEVAAKMRKLAKEQRRQYVEMEALVEELRRVPKRIELEEDVTRRFERLREEIEREIREIRAA